MPWGQQLAGKTEGFITHPMICLTVELIKRFLATTEIHGLRITPHLVTLFHDNRYNYFFAYRDSRGVLIPVGSGSNKVKIWKTPDEAIVFARKLGWQERSL